MDPTLARVLGEVLRLHRWADGGEQVDAARLFGLLHGIDSVVNQEEFEGVDEQTQTAIEDILEEVESGEQSPDGPAIKHRLLSDEIDEHAASLVMQLCRLQSRFVEGVDKLIEAPGSIFRHLKGRDIEGEDAWRGATQYVELIDTTAAGKMHAVWCASVPRVGEVVSVPRSSGEVQLTVIKVEHVLITTDDGGPKRRLVLAPHVHLE